MPLSENLPENKLDVNFVKLISPTYSMQQILGSNCLIIRGNIVSPLTIYQKLYTIFWIILVSGSFYCIEWSHYNLYYNQDRTLFYTFAFGWLVLYVSYLCIILHARFFKPKQTSEVLLKIQRIDCALKKHNMTFLSFRAHEYYINIMWIGCTLVGFGGGFAIYVGYMIENYMFAIPVGCAVISVYLEFILTGSCIYYLSLRLKLLNNVMRCNIINSKLLNAGIPKFREMIKNPMITIGAKNSNNMINLKSFTNILTSILKLFHDISNLFMFQLFIVVVTVLIWTFLVIDSTVVGLRNQLLPIPISVILIQWIIFNFLQLMAVAFTCDWFAEQVKDTRRLVLHSLSVYYEDKEVYLRKAAWELLQLLEFQKPIFSVYGIFIINMRLPLKLVGIITTNVLVLIQYTSNALNTH